MKIDGSEGVPARMVLPAAPIFESPDHHSPRLAGVRTLPTSPAQARGHAEEVLAGYRAQVKGGDRTAILELLDTYPELIAVPWVHEGLVRLAQGGMLRRRRGRPAGRFKLHPLFAVGLVYSLIGSKNEHIRNPEQAFGRIEALGICSYDSAKRAYYQGLREDRFRGVLFKLPGLQAIVQDQACSAPTPVVLLPGGSITATLTGNSDKTARIDFRAV